MSYNTRGFSLVEVVIALFIASILTISLYQLTKQTSRSVRSINTIVDSGETLMSFFSQVEKDITGIAVPRSTQEHYREIFNKQFKEQQTKDKQAQAAQAGPDAMPKPPGGASEQEKKAQESKDKIVKDVFVLDTKTGSLTLSFITTGGLQEFEVKDGNAKIKPQRTLKRVAYILQKDTDTETSNLIYKISRDSFDLSAVKDKKNFEEYILLRNVQNLSVTLMLDEFAEPNQKLDDKSGKRATQTIKNWSEDLINQFKTLIPAYLTLKGEVLANGRVNDFEYVFKVFAYEPFIPDIEKPEQPKVSQLAHNQANQAIPQSASQQPLKQTDAHANNNIAPIGAVNSGSNAGSQKLSGVGPIQVKNNGRRSLSEQAGTRK